jgi:hypothetical protein
MTSGKTPKNLFGEAMKNWWGVVARFFIHGLIVSTWVSRIPAVKSAIGLGDGAPGKSTIWFDRFERRWLGRTDRLPCSHARRSESS